MKEIDIIEQAREVVEDYLALIELVASTKQFQADHSSRLICRCRTCRAGQSRTVSWTQAMRDAPAEKPALAAAGGARLI